MNDSTLDPTGAAELFLSGARDAGLRHVCISPGSRSTPLAVAALRTEGLTSSVHLDERVGGFAALGNAIASGKPVGLICTSGTAGANYLPAVSEASLARVPLLVMTADRPPEHQDWGVGQTFEQIGLYHRQVRAQFTMAVGGEGGVGYTHRMGWRSALTAIEQAGPVHVNWPFRLPLEPVAGPRHVPLTFPPASEKSDYVDTGEVVALTALLNDAQKPIIIAGPDTIGRGQTMANDQHLAERFCNTAEAAHIPVLADVLSGLRGPERKALVSSPALVLERANIDGLDGADLVIHVGQTPTSKAMRLWWETQNAVHVLLDPSSTWNDPSHLATHRYRSSPVGLLEQALESSAVSNARAQHFQAWQKSGQRCAEVCERKLAAATTANEPQIAAALSRHAGAEDTIVASSSMPVRDIDMFASVDSATPVMANRGINGIDGVIATAAGIATAQSTERRGRTYVLIGDVALLHDVGGVLDAARNATPLVIIVPNNDGGGIFSFLPAREALDAQTFTDLFHTPHGTSFDFLASHAGISHVHATDAAEALGAADHSSTAVTIIEISVDTNERITFQRELRDELTAN